LAELPLHRIDPGEIGPHIVITASLMRRWTKAMCRKGMAGSGPTEVNDGGQILLLLECGYSNPSRSYCLYHAAVKLRRGQFNGMARYDSLVEAVEPA
jgi:hypothetical protein